MTNITDNLKKIFSQVTNIKFGAFSAENLLSAAVVFIICVIIIKLIMKITEKIIKKINVNNTISGFLKAMIKTILYFIAIIITVDILGVPVTSLVAVFGVAGLAISLSVQNSLSNIAGCFTIITTKPFVEGDYVETASVSGTVKEIGLFYTKITTFDNKLVNITNSDMAQSKIINYTAERQRRIDITVSASYNADIDEVENALKRSAQKIPEVLSEPPVFASVSDYKNSSVSYVLRAWVNTQDYWTVYYKILKNIKTEFDSAGIEMTYDHLNVHMVK